MKKDMPLEGLRWSRDSGSALYDTPPNGRSRTGWGGNHTFPKKAVFYPYKTWILTHKLPFLVKEFFMASCKVLLRD